MYPGGLADPAKAGPSERGGGISPEPALHAVQAVLDTLANIAQASDDGLQISLQCGAVAAVARALQVLISPRQVPKSRAFCNALQSAMHPLHPCYLTELDKYIGQLSQVFERLLMRHKQDPGITADASTAWRAVGYLRALLNKSSDILYGARLQSSRNHPTCGILHHVLWTYSFVTSSQ